MDTKNSSYIIEHHTVGQMTKVSAIDPATGTEVCVITPARLSQSSKENLAVKKLLYVLEKNKKPWSPF